jgi:hypothetical protein
MCTEWCNLFWKMSSGSVGKSLSTDSIFWGPFGQKKKKKKLIISGSRMFMRQEAWSDSQRLEDPMPGGPKMFRSLVSQGVFRFDGEWTDILESFPGPLSWVSVVHEVCLSTCTGTETLFCQNSVQIMALNYVNTPWQYWPNTSLTNT